MDMTIQRSRQLLLWMAFVWSVMVFAVSAAPVPGVDDLEKATAARLMAWALVIMSGVIVALAGVIVKVNQSRVASLEKQIGECRHCAAQLADAIQAVRQARG
jgi:uncharacterized membrane protein